MKLFLKIVRYLVYLYYTQPFYRTSTFGQNRAYCVQIFYGIAQATLDGHTNITLLLLLLSTLVERTFAGCHKCAKEAATR